MSEPDQPTPEETRSSDLPGKTRAAWGSRKTRTPVNSSQHLLDWNDLEDLTRMSRKTLQRRIDEGDFPRPIMQVRESSKRSAPRWSLAQYEQWVRRKMNESEKVAQ